MKKTMKETEGDDTEGEGDFVTVEQWSDGRTNQDELVVNAMHSKIPFLIRGWLKTGQETGDKKGGKKGDTGGYRWGGAAWPLPPQIPVLMSSMASMSSMSRGSRDSLALDTGTDAGSDAGSDATSTVPTFSLSKLPGKQKVKVRGRKEEGRRLGLRPREEGGIEMCRKGTSNP